MCFSAGMAVVDFSFYPDRDYQLAWLRTFLELMFAESGRPASDVTEVDVERLYVQVNKFSLVRLGLLSLFFTPTYLSYLIHDYLWTLSEICCIPLGWETCIYEFPSRKYHSIEVGSRISKWETWHYCEHPTSDLEI